MGNSFFGIGSPREADDLAAQERDQIDSELDLIAGPIEWVPDN